MKLIIKLSIFVCLLLTSTSSFSQQNGGEMVLPENISDYSSSTKKPIEMRAYRTKYIVDNKKLMSYFKSGQIPSSFPTYNYEISKEENIKLIKNWISKDNNEDLLSEDGKVKVAEVKEKISTKK